MFSPIPQNAMNQGHHEYKAVTLIVAMTGEKGDQENFISLDICDPAKISIGVS
jgi:hypothetical protein